MNAFKRKLSSKSGASIMIALLFFLICAIVGGIVLTSATSNAGRTANLREEQQSYLSVSSAAKLVEDELALLLYTSITVTDTTVYQDGTTPTLVETDNSYTISGGTLADTIGSMIDQIRTAGSPQAQTAIFTINSDESSLKEVSATLTLNVDYSIKAEFALSDGSEQHTMVLVVPATISYDPGTSSSTEIWGENDEFIGTKTSVTETTTIVWNSGTISKGGA